MYIQTSAIKSGIHKGLLLAQIIMLYSCTPAITPTSSSINDKLDVIVEDNAIVSSQAIKTFRVVDDCVIGLVLVGPKNDDGWSEMHYRALNSITSELGCELITFESLNPSASPDTTFQDIATMMVNRGADMVIAAADTFEEDAKTTADAYPSLAVLQISGSNRIKGTMPDNLSNSHSMQEASRYIAGCVAVRKIFSSLGQANEISIGYVGPLVNAETLRQASSAYLGARDCSAKLGLDPVKLLKFEVVWIGFWFNIPGVTLDPTEVSHSFFDRGSQVLISGIDTTEPIQVASSRHGDGDVAWAIGAHLDACEAGENACIGEQFYDWTITYRSQISALVAGNWVARWELRLPNWPQFTNSAPGATPVGFDIDQLSQQEQDFVEEVIDDLYLDAQKIPTMFPGWRGPLKLQDGTIFASEGEIPSPLKVWFLPNLIDGIVGKSTNK